MVKRPATIRPLLLGCVLCSLTLLADAQNQSSETEKEVAPPSRGFFMVPAPNAVVSSSEATKTEKSDKPTDNVVNSLGVLSPEQAGKFEQQLKERQAKLRAQLADPKLRAQAVAERIEQQRSLNPDLAPLLRLEPRTESKLLALLADEQLSQELQAPGFFMSASSPAQSDGKPYNPLRDEAARYSQRMTEITRIIGSARLDDYVDYERKLGMRGQVSRFDDLLPAESKLTLEQRNALTDLFYDQVYRTNPGFHSFGRSPFGDLNQSAEERNRRMQLINIATNERYATTMETTNRELVERATSILTPEQTKVLADSKQREVSQQRAWTQQQRRSLGIAPDEVLDVEDEVLPSPPISKNLRLTIDLTINDTQVVKKLTSVRGGAVSFDAPEGLVAEVRPYMDQEHLNTEIKLYEKVRGGRRLVGQMGGGAQLIERGKPSRYGGSGSSVTRGRKGYAITWSVSGMYL